MKVNFIPGPDDEANKVIKDLQKKSSIWRKVMIAEIVLFVVFLIMWMMPLVVVDIIVFVVTIIVQGHYEGTLKKYCGENILPEILNQVFDNISYDKDGRIAKDVIDSCRMGFKHYNTVYGSDLIKGTYRGLPFELSDIRLTYETVSTDSEGNETTHEEQRFKGMWLICDFHKSLKTDLSVWEYGKTLIKNGIKTENDAFNKQFHVESSDEANAFYVLTPNMMEYITKMDEKASGQTHMYFTTDGKVHIAIDSGRDAFEIDKNDKSAEQIREKYRNDVKYITDIIDELRIVDIFS